MKLIIQTVDKATFEVDVLDNGTLQDLRTQISTIKNHPSDQIKLIYDGAVLSDNTKKLSEYKLTDGAKLVILMQKPKAAPKQPEKPVEEKKVVEDKFLESEMQNVQDPVQIPQMPQMPQIPGMPGQFANMAQQDPEGFMQMLMTDPFISQIAQQNPQFFAQVINDPNFLNNLVQAEPTEEDAMYEIVFDGEIQLTDEQKKDVNEIITMGFPFEDVIQYYIAYDHNKEMALNALFSEKFGD